VVNKDTISPRILKVLPNTRNKNNHYYKINEQIFLKSKFFRATTGVMIEM